MTYVIFDFSLAPDKMSGILSIDEFVTRWCKTVYEAMSRHLEDPSVQVRMLTN